MQMSSVLTGALALVSASHAAQVPPGFKPSVHKPLSVKVGEKHICPGELVPLADTKVGSPEVRFPEYITDCSSHLVIMIDLDAPGGLSDNSYSPLLHWMSYISPRQCTPSSNATADSQIAQYAAPAPQAGQGPHRYVLLLLADLNNTSEGVPEDLQKLEFPDLSSRVKWDLGKFVKEGGYKTVAANWFRTEFVTGIDDVAVTEAGN